MNVEKIIINKLNTKLSDNPEEFIKKQILEFFDFMKENSFYDAVVKYQYEIFNLWGVESDDLISSDLFAKIYIDMIKSSKSQSLIVYLINKNYSLNELLIKFPNLKDIILNSTFEQMNAFLYGNDNLIENQYFYNLILEKFKQDKRFISFLPIDQKLVNLGLLEDRLKNGSFDLLQIDLDIALKIVDLIDQINIKINEFDLSYIFKSNNKQLIYAILNNNKIMQKLMDYSLLDYVIKALPSDALEKLILNQNFINSLSFSKKVNLVIAIKSHKLQGFLINQYHILDNIRSLDTFLQEKLLISINDENIIVEFILKSKIYLDDESNQIIQEILKRLSKENQYLILESPDFTNYLKKLRYDAVKEIVLVCDLEIINKFYKRIKNISSEDIYDLCVLDPSPENISLLIEYLQKDSNQKILEQIFNFSNCETILLKLTDENINMLLDLYDINESFNTTNFNFTSTIENKDKLEQIRNKLIEKFIAFLQSNNSINLEFIKFKLLSLLNDEQTDIYLSHFDANTLFLDLKYSDKILDYFYNNFDSLFSKMDLNGNNSIKLISGTLSGKSLSKLREIYFKLPFSYQLMILDENLLEDEKIKNNVISDFKTNYLKYFANINQTMLLLKKLTDEEKYNILKEININFLILILQNTAQKDKVLNRCILERKEEFLNNLRKNDFLPYQIENLLNVNIALEEFLPYLSNDNLFTLYKKDKYSRQILEYLKYRKEIILNTNMIQEFIVTLNYDEINYLFEDYNINELIDIFIKSKNKYLEELLMKKFIEQPYFINDSEYPLSKIISILDDKNIKIMVDMIEKQFKELNLPESFKNKIRNISFDDKIFLIYMFKTNLINSNKLQFIEKILDNDPFALRNLNPMLFNDKIFSLCKDIIPLIYRYKDLTINLIKLINESTLMSKIILILVEYWKKSNVQNQIVVSKLNVFVNVLKYTNQIQKIKLGEVNWDIETIKLFEKVIIKNNSRQLLFGGNVLFCYSVDLFDKGFAESEKDEISKLKFDFENSNDIEVLKQSIIGLMFGIKLDDSLKLVRQYETSISKIKKYLNDPMTTNIFYFLKVILETNDITILRTFYNNFENEYSIDDLLKMKFDFEQAYNKNIANSLKGYKNGKNIIKKIKINGQIKEINVIELTDDFNMFAHSTDAYGSMDLINDNYFDSWNYCEKTKNNGICTAYLSDNNLGTAGVFGNGVMFGFIKLNSDSISSMAPYDIVSANDGIQVSSYRPPMFMSIDDLSKNIRHTHSEAVLRRRNLNSTFPVVQPDCLIMYEEMSDEIKENTLKAQKDFKEYGVDLPIVYINRKEIVKNKGKQIDKMIDSFEQTYDLKELSEIINKYESVRTGLNFDTDINASELLHKSRIYNDLILFIKYIIETNNEILLKEFLNVIKLEQAKFDLIKECLGERANTFDLLDENMHNELNDLINYFSITKTVN